MKSRKFGRTGFTVSEVGHGLWGMGDWTDSEDEQSRVAIRASIEGGCTFFDSAHAYGSGHSDRLIGEVARDYAPDAFAIASKVPPKNWSWPSRPEFKLSEVFPRDHVLEMAQTIRKDLGRDTIDLLQFHVWEDAWAEEAEWQDTVQELKDTGVIAAFGLSLNRWEPENGLRAVRTGCVDAVQVIYNIFDQAPEDKLFPLCRENNVGVIARVPLDEGGLTGALTLETRFPEADWRSRYFGEKNLPETVKRADVLKELTPDGATLPEMAMRFILNEPAVSTMIVGMRKLDHVRANMAVSDTGPLDDALHASLREHRWDRSPSDWSD